MIPRSEVEQFRQLIEKALQEADPTCPSHDYIESENF